MKLECMGKTWISNKMQSKMWYTHVYVIYKNKYIFKFQKENYYYSMLDKSEDFFILNVFKFS